MKTLADITVDNKTVLLRVDFNVPIDETGLVMDTSRIEAVKPTVDYLRERNAKILFVAHFGRPKGKVDDALRFEPIVPVISEVLGGPVAYVSECVGPKVEQAIEDLPAGGMLMLENVRFHLEEKANDADFAKQLASLADVYINDAFGAAHRAHASTSTVAKFLPHAAGLLMQREVEELQKLTDHPAKPIVAIIGGSKISTKLALITTLLPKVEYLLLGGALANTVLLAQNHKIGKSLVEEELADTVKDLLDNKLRVPVDVVVAKEIKEDAETRIIGVGMIEEDDYILDIGPDTVKMYVDCMEKAKTIIWNGPMGVFEMEAFAMGTYHLAKEVANSSAYSVLGGGETVSAVNKVGLENQISFISTGGGAMLEFLEGKELPGIKALD